MTTPEEVSAADRAADALRRARVDVMVDRLGPGAAVDPAELYGLGAIPNLDPRSRNYPSRALLPQGLAPRSYTWSCPVVLNQGSTGTCVGHSAAHELAARPQLWPVGDVGGLNYLAKLIYLECCKIDPWTQNDGGDLGFGTDTLSAAKTLVALGFWGAYRWAFSESDRQLAVGYQGPTIWAIPWYNSMFTPDAQGRIRVDPASGLAGWHAILNNGINITRRDYRLHNSWGPGWGVLGEGFVSFEDATLLLKDGGSVLVPERRTSV